ncbi:MAG: synthase subunit b [Gemmataceae bacterium]|nr:synthase subunit b [Gemmataceae bacterium]
MRSRLSVRPVLPFALAVVSVLAVVGVAAAAGHGDEEKSGGLSFLQLHRYDLGIFTLIVFGLLVLILQRYAWPKISEGLQKREAVILGAREDAQKARQEAEELRARLQKDYADAHDKIRAMLDEARKDADALRAAEREAGAKDAQAERERARKELKAEEEAIRLELREYAVQLASMLSAKVIRRELSPEDHRRLLAESLAELKSGIVKA